MSGSAGIYMSVESGAMALHMVIRAIIPPLPNLRWGVRMSWSRFLFWFCSFLIFGSLSFRSS